MNLNWTVLWPLVAATVTVVTLWVVVALAVDKDWLGRSFGGEDNRPSTSKFQFVFWTLIALFSFVAIFTRHLVADPAPPPNIAIPVNLFLLMGISTGSAVAAKLITISNPLKRRAELSKRGDLRYLFVDDFERPAVDKIQLMAWTGVAGATYLVSLTAALAQTPVLTSLPNIDDAMLVLMGVSNAGYLAPKAVAAADARRKVEAAGPSPVAPEGGGGAEEPAAIVPPMPVAASALRRARAGLQEIQADLAASNVAMNRVADRALSLLQNHRIATDNGPRAGGSAKEAGIEPEVESAELRRIAEEARERLSRTETTVADQDSALAAVEVALTERVSPAIAVPMAMLRRESEKTVGPDLDFPTSDSL
jgi:hypothetical protein